MPKNSPNPYTAGNRAASLLVYVEARNRVGGRMRSLANAAGTNVTVELGGEFIDTDHTKLRSLAQELGLTIVDILATDKGLVPDPRILRNERFSDDYTKE
ncbi:FAD-dependent oxidoreductase [Nostoc sp.]|uniref:FAD-dependent oxidoreductase n=1 Tax=Nostoc sp. TaxID=1180 RepID=UPI002FEEF0A6